MSAEAPTPIRVLELRTVTGQGGGPEKTLLNGAADAPRGLAVTLCFLRRPQTEPLWVETRARELGIDYLEIRDRHPLDLRIWPALRALVADRGIHLVHSHDYKADLYAWLLQRATPVRAIATAHGWTGRTSRERALYYPADRLLLASFPKVIAVSSEIRDRLLRAGADPGRVEVLLNGIATPPAPADAGVRDRVRGEWRFDSSERVIGTVGRLDRQKRLDLLLDAFVMVRRRFAEARLVIVGDGRLAAPLRRRARAAGVLDDVRFLGYRRDAGLLQEGFDVYVQASAYEGSANAVLEAMLAGTPVVATAVGGTAELLCDGVHGLLVEPGSAAPIAAAVASVFDRPEAAAARARAAQVRARTELSFAQRQQRLLEIYRELLATRAGGDPRRLTLEDRATT